MIRGFLWTKRKETIYNRYKDNGHEDDEETNILFCRSSKSSNNGQEMQTSKVKEQYLERELQPSDTLQSLALEFNCPVAELKRVNKIIRENEIFARKVVKIPVKYYSLLTEQLPSVHTTVNKNKKECSTPDGNMITNIVNTSPVYTQQGVEHKDDISQQTEIEATESDILLSCSDDRDMLKVEEKDGLNCDGSDWGLSWFHVLIISVLLAIIVPVVCYLYIIKVSGPHHHFNITHFNVTHVNTSKKV